MIHITLRTINKFKEKVYVKQTVVNTVLIN